ncbi:MULTISPECIES: SDR family NAD(P)-dependent oxidoreductase [Levilactobacillus]|uniref:SDR family NAD(P)-dependent oxidoreductase n=1 Tax=Levilactobacillus TaxID=2767886 RepID=UPI00194E6040|nr:SDR family NAD(P)-dependent oxidoreductase [Levilactobacillus sp. 244-2]
MTKTVVILGAGSGFGFAIAQAFGQQGKHVVLAARHENALQHMTAQLRAADISADWLVADATNSQSTADLFRQVVQHFGVPETFVYNVADTQLDRPRDTPATHIAQAFDVNVLGAIRTTRQFLDLDDTDIPRNILITGGGAALNPVKATTTLSLTKAALRSYAYSLADELADTAVYVGLITIQGISGTSDAMQPANVAQAFLQAVADRNQTELRYPVGEQSESEFSALKAVMNDSDRLQTFLQKHPGVNAFLQQHPEFLTD